MTEKNAVYREREADLRREELGRKVLENARNELYLNMRFLDTALSSLAFMADRGIRPAGTDGKNLFFDPADMTGFFRADRRRINRIYMHILVHCLFGHLFTDPESFMKPESLINPESASESENASGGQPDTESEKALWDLSCDIAAEYLLDDLLLPCLHQRKSALRQEVWAQLRSALPVVTAQLVYRYIQEKHLSPEEMASWAAEFRTDDHARWHTASKKQQRERQQHWEDLRSKMQTAMETFSKEASSNAQALHDSLAVENRQRYDYKDFLRKFSVLREEIQADPDSFDYIFYHYGMQLYHNMPLIEPLETREIRRIEDFVIVIDTSMSCKKDLIRKFLEETYTILTSRSSFSRKVHVRLIQCDDQIRRDTRITNLEQIKSYMTDFQILGLGGTDFRPAFAYVNGLLAMGEFHHLKGLLYFTDGYGIFPVKKPLYETAFIFMKYDYSDVDVPPWAMKVILGEEMMYEH